MQYFLYLTFLSIFTLDFLNRYGVIPRQLTWLPELLSLVAFVLIAFAITSKRALSIGLGYWLIFVLILIHIIFGIIINDVSTPVLFSGLRTYLKYIPFFFIPAIAAFSEKDMTKQLKFLLGLTLIQFPIVIYQRFIESSGMRTGDYVRGTLGTSSYLSIYLLAAYSFVFVLYSKNYLTLKSFILVSILILIPTTLNETKGTIILLPFAILLPALFCNEGKLATSAILKTSLIGVIFLVVFSFAYDSLYERNYSISEFYTSQHRLESSLSPKTSGLHDERQGRIDVIISPFQALSKQPLKLIYGLGIGNVSQSFLGKKFTGEYYLKYGDKMYLAISQVIWEIGLLGLILIIIFMAKVTRDAYKIRRFEGISGSIAIAWIGVMGIVFVSLFYKNIITQNAIGYLFWYFCGYIVIQQNRIKTQTD